MNQRGMSLVQVTIAAALAAGIGLYLAKMTDNASKSASGFRQKMAYNIMKKEIEEAMGDQQSCFNTLTLNADSTTAPRPIVETDPSDSTSGIKAIYYFNPNANNNAGQNIELYRSSPLHLYEGLEIEAIDIKDTRGLGPDDLPIDGIKWMIVKIKKSRMKGFGPSDRDMFIRIHVQLNSDGDLVSCAAGKMVDIVRNVCNGYGAVYDENTNRCDIIGIDGAISCPTSDDPTKIVFRGLRIDVSANGQKRLIPICE